MARSRTSLQATSQASREALTKRIVRDMPYKPDLTDPFVAAEAEIKAFSDAEAAVSPSHAEPPSYNPFMTGLDAANLRTSVRALGSILIRFERLVSEMMLTWHDQTKAILENAKINQSILGELIEHQKSNRQILDELATVRREMAEHRSAMAAMAAT